MLLERILRKVLPTIEEGSVIDTGWPIICCFIKPAATPATEFHQYDRYILTVRRFDTYYPVSYFHPDGRRKLCKELPMTYTTIFAWMPRLIDKEGKAYFRFMESN